MDIINDFTEKLLNFMPGGVYGILSMVIGIIGDILAILYYPGYNMIDNMVSDLSRGIGSIFFNFGLIFSGLVAIPFYLHLGRILKTEIVN